MYKTSNHFNKRNNLKQEVHFGNLKEFYLNAGEIWYVNLGANVGYEEDGKGNEYKRPMLVVEKQGNMFLCIAMTTKGKNNRFYHRISDRYFGRASYLIFTQMRTIDKKRFIKKIGELNDDDMNMINKRLGQFRFKQKTR